MCAKNLDIAAVSVKKALCFQSAFFLFLERFSECVFFVRTHFCFVDNIKYMC